MSFRSLLTDKCDIYHLRSESVSTGYGLPGEAGFVYADTPDEVDIPCKFTEKSQTITQGEPGNEIVQSYSVCFLYGIDVRLNDKFVFGGAEYKAQIPQAIKRHHIEVVAMRKGKL